MMPIKTKEFASLLVAAVAAIVVAAAMWLLEAVWWQTLCVGRFVRGGRDVPDRGAVRPLCDP